ncbi:MAG: hypothetical protein M1817_000347 [Caeruleum heppii]|nr:MAG: hypothetical protein M1817_000347 [Caeruleum heppii]
MDAQAALVWASTQYGHLGKRLKVVLWGQSIGAGVATTAAAWSMTTRASDSKESTQCPIDGLILETPFLSVQKMLVALYPQKWLPYRYLGPFLRNTWDSEAAFRTMSDQVRVLPAGGRQAAKILVLQAGKDEIVPPEQGDKLASEAQNMGLDVSKVNVTGALHTGIIACSAGRKAIQDFLQLLVTRGRSA